tara:strand:- start:279 stop:554 length:276 start_codon:yes stop_codon:yes gene_type:complete
VIADQGSVIARQAKQLKGLTQEKGVSIGEGPQVMAQLSRSAASTGAASAAEADQQVDLTEQVRVLTEMVAVLKEQMAVDHSDQGSSQKSLA